MRLMMTRLTQRGCQTVIGDPADHSAIYALALTPYLPSSIPSMGFLRNVAGHFVSFPLAALLSLKRVWSTTHSPA
jgi:hypothetical protein